MAKPSEHDYRYLLDGAKTSTRWRRNRRKSPSARHAAV
jgi:hypothetical protein